MSDPESPTEPSEGPATEPEPTGPSRAERRGSRAKAKPTGTSPGSPSATAAPPAKAAAKPSEGPRAPRRPTLEPELARLLAVRDAIDERRPLFVRTASHRYARIGRWGSWRRPRGLQSKQRRHYGYRPVVVSIGFRSPRRTRGLTPTGFKPVLVRTSEDLTKLDALTESAIIARTVGVHKRLALEEAARKLGVRIANPITGERRGES